MPSMASVIWLAGHQQAGLHRQRLDAFAMQALPELIDVRVGACLCNEFQVLRFHLANVPFMQIVLNTLAGNRFRVSSPQPLRLPTHVEQALGIPNSQD